MTILAFFMAIPAVLSTLGACALFSVRDILGGLFLLLCAVHLAGCSVYVWCL